MRSEAILTDRENLRHPGKKGRISYVAKCLKNHAGPVIAASDYLKVFADQIRVFVPNDYYVLGIDGFGGSDIRKYLRYFF